MKPSYKTLLIKLSLVSVLLGCSMYSVPPNNTNIPKIIINPATKMILHEPGMNPSFVGYEGIVVNHINALTDEHIMLVKGNEQVLVENKGINARGIGGETIQIAHIIWEYNDKRIAFVVEEPDFILQTYLPLLKKHGYVKE